jgi:hypothetical protein
LRGKTHPRRPVDGKKAFFPPARLRRARLDLNFEKQRGKISMEYKPIEKRMLQLQKVSEVFQGNVERLSNINKSLIG